MTTEAPWMAHSLGVNSYLCAIFLLIVCMRSITLAAQNNDGFISIDCGSRVSHYEDSETHLMWTNDEGYVKTGFNGVVPHPVNSSLDNHVALQSFRYFPDARSKYCYDLATKAENVSILIRAMFYHGDSSLLSLPIIFDVYVNGSQWSSVEYNVGDITTLTSPKILEGIFFAAGSTTHFCLLPREGVPFISSLEVREFDAAGIMYSFKDREKLYLNNLIRWRAGVAADAPTVRYPDDAYDRLWITRGEEDVLPVISANANDSLFSSLLTSSKVNNVPVKIMENAWTGYVNNSGVTIYPNLAVTSPTGYLYAVFYFLDFKLTEHSVGRIMTISLNDDTSPAFRVTRNITTQSFSNSILSTSGQSSLSLSLNSNSAPILNAMEFYQENIFEKNATAPDDVRLISFLKERFNMTSWGGDPCVPVPYNWITCVPAWNEDLPYFLGVDSIILSNLSNSSGLLDSAPWVNSYNSPLYLDSMYLTHSNVDDTTFQFLIQYFLYASLDLDTLDVSYNSITSVGQAEAWPSNNNLLTNLSLSHNHISGQVPSFADYPFSNVLQMLNLSFNSFNSLSNSWENSSAVEILGALTIVDFSYNDITGNLSLLSDFVFHKDSHLKEVYMSNNKLGASFPSSLFFSKSSSLKVLNLDQNNFQGTLDLTQWNEKLRNFNFTVPTDQILLSLVNNSISDVNPPAEHLQPVIDILMNDSRLNQSGVLLGGNPYCAGANSFAHKYLCRSSVHDVVAENPKKKSKKLFIIAGVAGGVLALLLGCIIVGVIWKLQTQVNVLRDFQQELANRRVQPPFFSYHDLRIATKDFHKDFLLGSGASGAIYKGILQDGTTIAVKKLFHDQQHEGVLNDFLNEVVLITGIKHKNLVQLNGCCVTDKERILVYEYAEEGNLGTALWGSRSKKALLSWKARLNICIGTARGLSYLHEELQPRIIHRDIKAVNVLLDKDLNSKIADFGLAKPFCEEDSMANFTFFAGTRGYLAPEYILDGQLTEKADVYSFGILLLEIVSGRKSIDSAQSIVSLKSWAEELEEEGNLLKLLQPQLGGQCLDDEVLKVINIALACSRTDPKGRPTMSQVVVMLVQIADNGAFPPSSETSPLLERVINYKPEPRNVRQPGSSAATDQLERGMSIEMDTDEEFDEVSLIGTSRTRPSFQNSNQFTLSDTGLY